MGDDHAYLLSVSDWVNSLSLPLEATAAIVTCTRGAPARFLVGERVSRVFRFSVSPSHRAGPGV